MLNFADVKLELSTCLIFKLRVTAIIASDLLSVVIGIVPEMAKDLTFAELKILTSNLSSSTSNKSGNDVLSAKNTESRHAQKLILALMT
ncbi:hypothetical protein GCM10017161_11900 [Thalassotalea marina]|uniref:Uncharacterized protein n=1 Tax=Thalassotalea marina TaxID=1673741 RepID=A0A919EJD4_9GAMM|nr:hypothetical protein GCM10017161_11900 [Thalassotalea marina]